MHPPETFAGRLYLARVNAGLDQRELGAQVGLSAHTIGRLERGSSTTVKVEVLRNLLRVLDVTANWLLVLDVDGETPDSREIDSQLMAPHPCLAASVPCVRGEAAYC